VIKFCTSVGYIKSQQGGQITLKRGVVMVMWPILNFGPSMTSLERQKLESSKYAHMQT